MQTPTHPLIFVVGPTAVGKSDWALAQAREFRGGIVNCDSLQVFTDLNIGTAKPSKVERSQCPHFLFDVVGAGERFTAGRFRDAALDVITQHSREMPLFLVGGSGFYILALQSGMYEVTPIPPQLTQKLHQRFAREELGDLFKELQRLDPEYAHTISPQDRYRIFRGLALLYSQNKTVTELRREKAPSPLAAYQTIKIGLTLSKDALRHRVKERTRKMLEQGLIDEVSGLLKPEHELWAPLGSVGYKECRQYLEGAFKLAELAERIELSTMKLVKKQMTWFKKDSDIHWFEADPVGLAQAAHYLKEQM